MEPTAEDAIRLLDMVLAEFAEAAKAWPEPNRYSGEVAIGKIALRNLVEQFDALEQRHNALLDLARRVSNSFIATQDRFGKDRRRLLWDLHDAVESSPASGDSKELRVASSPATSPNGEQTREQLLERLALTVKEAIDGGSFDGTLFESQVSGTLWLLYGEQSPAKEPS